MIKLTRTIVFLIMMFIASQVGHTQGLNIPESERADLEQAALAMLENFTSYITLIGDKKYNDTVRTIFIDKAVALFEPHSIMEVSSLNSSEITQYPIRRYLQRLMNLKYDQIQISFIAEAIYFNLASFEQIPNTQRYVGAASITQVFCGTYNSVEKQKWNYCNDVTQKVVAVIVEKIKGASGEHWRVLLGDITVKETKRL